MTMGASAHIQQQTSNNARNGTRLVFFGLVAGLLLATAFQTVIQSSMYLNCLDMGAGSVADQPWIKALLVGHYPDDGAPSKPPASPQQAPLLKDWPGVAVEKIGSPLVYKGSNFVEDTRALTFQYLDEFLSAYSNRPDKVNLCGIRINHALALYLTVKVLQPTTIIESGVNAGQSTYFMRAAAPNARIYAIDPLAKPICGQATRWIDTEGPVEYFTGSNFKDIEDIDWDSKIRTGEMDPNKTLAFLDDHLVVFERLAILMRFGIRHVLLEDNYKVGEGGTMKDRAGFTPKQMFRRVDDDSIYLWNNLVSYSEFPPLVAPVLAKNWKGKRKAAGGFLFHTDSNVDIVPPILNAHDTDDEQGRQDYSVYERICRELSIDPLLEDDASYMQIMNYNQISYFELVPMAPRIRSRLADGKVAF